MADLQYEWIRCKQEIIYDNERGIYISVYALVFQSPNFKWYAHVFNHVLVSLK